MRLISLIHESELQKKTPPSPHLEDDAIIIFDYYVAGVDCYLEYGAGGSTLRAKYLDAKNIISVESSLVWANKIKSSLSSSSNVDLIYCDIGAVGEWGRPNDLHGLSNYHSYMSKPWAVAKQKSLSPRLVLIDGRFRVASFLYSLLCAKKDTIILFDDYTNRAHYHIVEKFCSPLETYGRMALFKVKKDFMLPEIVASIAEYSIISD